MTIKQLIKELKKYDEDKTVFYLEDYVGLGSVQEDDEGNVLLAPGIYDYEEKMNTKTIAFLLKDIIPQQKYLIAGEKANKKLLFDMYKKAIIDNIIPLISEKLNIKYKINYNFNVYYSIPSRDFCVRFEAYNEQKLVNYLKYNYESISLLDEIIQFKK